MLPLAHVFQRRVLACEIKLVLTVLFAYQSRLSVGSPAVRLPLWRLLRHLTKPDLLSVAVLGIQWNDCVGGVGARSNQVVSLML